MTSSQACSIASARIRHTGPPLATVAGGISWSISPEASVMCPGRLSTLPGDLFGVNAVLGDQPLSSGADGAALAAADVPGGIVE
jgi:hypothetical protein